MWCAHVWTYDGRVSSAPPSVTHCERPNRFVCKGCGEVVYSACYMLDCAPCAELKRGDLKAVFRSGASVSPSDRLYFVTLTAPGEKPTRNGYRLRWDRAACRGRHSDSVPCSGDLGCVVLKADADAWNAGLPKRWSYFRQYMQRSTGCEVQVVGVWEAQERGALHRHALVRVSGVCTERAFRAAVRSYRDAHDFGRMYDVQVIDSSDPRAVAIVAGYLGKYCVKSYGDLGDVACGYSVRPDSLSGSLVRRRRLRGWSASRQWGDTLAVCRARRTGYWAALVAQGARGGTQLAAPALAPAAGGGLDPYSEHSTHRMDTPSVVVSESGSCAM